MFENQRYVSRGAANCLTLDIQNMLWLMIEGMEVSSKDRFQIFTLSVSDGQQKIVHMQERPHYEKEFVYAHEKPVSEKVFVIDDDTHTTMILASEY